MSNEATPQPVEGQAERPMSTGPLPPLKGPRCQYVFPSTGTLCMAPLYMCSHPQPRGGK